MKGRSLAVTVLAFMLMSACNKDEYMGTRVAVEGVDAACSEGKDVASCEAISGCQVAYEDVESVDPIFAACIANPPAEDPVVNPPVVNPPTSTTDNNSNDSKDDDEVTVGDAYQANCENVKPSCKHVKNYSDDQGHSKKMERIKICHQTSNGQHAIIVACPALKGHRKHDDYLGACKE